MKVAKFNINIRNFNNDTPLHIAAEMSTLLNVKLLLAHGADTEVQGRNGQTGIWKFHYSSQVSFSHCLGESL